LSKQLTPAQTRLRPHGFSLAIVSVPSMGGMISKNMDAVETGMANADFSVPHAEPAIIGKSPRIGVGIPNSGRPTLAA
jgi:hypothetical protein